MPICCGVNISVSGGASASAKFNLSVLFRYCLHRHAYIWETSQWLILWWDFVTENDSLHSFMVPKGEGVDCRIKLVQN